MLAVRVPLVATLVVRASCRRNINRRILLASSPLLSQHSRFTGVGGRVALQKLCPRSDPRNLSVRPYLEKGSLQM